MDLLADRFLRRNDRWFDVASARDVLVRVFGAGPRREQLAWAERCAMLATLRHPLLHTLIDYGAAGPRSLFEAFEPAVPVAHRCAAVALAAHARRFVQAHGVSFSTALTLAPPPRPPRERLAPTGAWHGQQPDRANPAPRVAELKLRAAGGLRPRPIGLVLQPRRALATLADLVADPPVPGVTRLTLTGAPGSGLRTLVMGAAHIARAAGYVPVCPLALLRWPELVAHLAGRHVCVLAWQPASRVEGAALAGLLVTLAEQSARAHLCLTADRTARGAGLVVHLDPMRATQMSSMIYRDDETGPSLDEIFTASRRSAGNPGRFLAELGARPFGASCAQPLMVHEAPAVYEVSPPEPAASATAGPQDRRRLDAAALRARPRAADLIGRGRHAAAGRLLARAGRVLEARGAMREAGQCWLQLGWMMRNRGALARAVELAERARTADPMADARVGAACLVAVCWTDDERFTEAEASLRSLAAAASTLSDQGLNARCLLALARVLYWGGRIDETLATLEPLVAISGAEIACEALARRARARLRIGELPGAVASARDACRRATASGSAYLRVVASRAMADVLLAVGDAEAAHAEAAAALAAAATARLPLARLRLRALMLRASEAVRGRGAETARLRAILERSRRRALPPIVRRQLDPMVVDRPGRDPHAGIDPSGDGVARVGRFLDAAQRAPDDAAAIAAVLAALCEEAGAASAALVAADQRVLGAAGRPWRDRCAAADQAVTTGRPVPPQPAAQPEAASPVSCGGTLFGAIGCRWGTAVAPPAQASALLHAASLAVAVHVRSVLEAGPAAPPPAAWGDLLGESAAAGALRDAILRAARAPFPVLIEGESGSGKELVARGIHRLSPRHTRRFCAINCAALSDDLVEAELFGHVRGAYTGASTDRPGLFEDADGGTLFLDEVGELSARAQAKLLRVLQEGEVRRVGENLPRRVDVRIVAATNRRLEHEAAGGRFRTDLHFRLDVLRITVPPLRERATDIPILAQHFWQQACARIGSRATLGADALAALARYDWPGNVRELQNAIAWTAVHGPRRGRISASALPARLAAVPIATGSFEAAREDFERRYVRAALAEAGGQRQVAARALGISRQGLAKMLRRLGIEGNGSA